MSGDYVTAPQLRSLLENKYKCKYDGKDLSPPYKSSDDTPDWYISPSGHCFAVPQPPDGAGFKQWMVEKIIEAGKLEVVVPMEKKPEKAEKSETEN